MSSLKPVLTLSAYVTDRPTMPALKWSRLRTAKSAAKNTMQLPTNSSRTASHLKQTQSLDVDSS